MKKIEKNGFITKIKKMYKDNSKYEDKAYDSVIDKLFIKNIYGYEKAMGLDEYNSELNTKLTLIPGHIYAFRYNAKTPCVYDNGDIHFEYSDTLPILLCTNNTPTTISGINLNFCNYGLRTLILNDIYNLDPDFFEQNASDEAHKGNFPISKRISSFFLSKDNQTKFLKRIVDKYNITNYNLIFRTYNPKNIKTIRFIEPWQWKYIPFVNYKQNIKTDILKLILHITQIEKIKI